MHAIGDRATRDALDAIEAARAANGPRDNRHHVAHLQFVHPDDVPRFGSLGVVANMQPLWACMDPQMTELTLPRVGRSGSGGSTRSAIWSARARRSPAGATGRCPHPTRCSRWRSPSRGWIPGERDAEPFLPDQRLTIAAGVRRVHDGLRDREPRRGAAGSIEVGKRADLAVLDRDVFAADAGPSATRGWS